MSYKSEFGYDFNLGFDLHDYPQFVDKSWHNDVCPSFYFKIGNNYYVLWVDFEDTSRREQSSARYTVISAENIGCDETPDIVCGENGVEVFSSEDVKKLSEFIGIANLDTNAEFIQ